MRVDASGARAASRGRTRRVDDACRGYDIIACRGGSKRVDACRRGVLVASAPATRDGEGLGAQETARAEIIAGGGRQGPGVGGQEG